MTQTKEDEEEDGVKEGRLKILFDRRDIWSMFEVRKHDIYVSFDEIFG